MDGGSQGNEEIHEETDGIPTQCLSGDNSDPEVDQDAPTQIIDSNRSIEDQVKNR